MAFLSDADQRVSTLARPAHQFFARRRGVANAAFDLHADDIELHVGIERRPEDAQALPNGVQFWAPGAANGNVNFLHFWSRPIARTAIPSRAASVSQDRSARIGIASGLRCSKTFDRRKPASTR